MDITRIRRLLILCLLIVALFLLGVVYFYFRTGNNFIEALWITVNIISTMGSSDASEFNGMDKLISVILVISGVIMFSFLIAFVSELIFSGQLRNYFGKRKMKDKIDNMKNHYILCGFGRIGKAIHEGLKAEHIPHVIIENNHDNVTEIMDRDNVIIVEADSTHDDALKEAGIDRAKGIFCSLGEDAANLLTVLNARALNRNIRIVTRISSQELEKRFLRAGADHCISPQSWGSQSMLLTMLNPTMTQMLNLFLSKTIESGTFDEIEVPENSPISGKTLGNSDIRKVSNINVIGIRKAKDKIILVNPQPETLVEGYDTLICLGNHDNFVKLREHLGYK
jgi:voltage-gated potassium channel